MKNQCKRVTGSEQYYTPQKIALRCVDIMLEQISESPEYWVEPSGGTGSFIDALLFRDQPEQSILSWDILPLHRLVKPCKDFLLEDLSILSNARSVVTIGNPPFGRCHSLSVKFFNKLADHSDYIGFIIPVSWRKWSILNRLDQRFHLLTDESLLVNFEGEGVKKTSRLKTCFQVYERRETLRNKVIIEDRGYVEKVSQYDADISLTVFGVYGRKCGEVFDDPSQVKPQTQLFLRLKEPWVREALHSVNYSKFSSNSALESAQSLSFQEILHLLNEYRDAQ